MGRSSVEIELRMRWRQAQDCFLQAIWLCLALISGGCTTDPAGLGDLPGAGENSAPALPHPVVRAFGSSRLWHPGGAVMIASREGSPEFATVGKDGTVCFWESREGRLLAICHADMPKLVGAELLADGSVLLCEVDGMCRVVTRSDRGGTVSFRACNSRVAGVCASARGTEILLLDERGVLFSLDLQTRRTEEIGETGIRRALRIAATDDLRTVAVASPLRVRLYSRERREVTREDEGPEDPLALTFHAAMETFLVADVKGRLLEVPLDPALPARNKAVRDGGIRAIAVSAKDGRIFAGCSDWSLCVLDPVTLEVERSIDAGGRVAALSVAADGDIRLALSHGRILLLRPTTCERRLPASGHDSAVFELRFSPEGRYLLSRDVETARIWDLQRGESHGEPIGISSEVAAYCMVDSHGGILVRLRSGDLRAAEGAMTSRGPVAPSDERLRRWWVAPDSGVQVLLTGTRLEIVNQGDSKKTEVDLPESLGQVEVIAADCSGERVALLTEGSDAVRLRSGRTGQDLGGLPAAVEGLPFGGLSSSGVWYGPRSGRVIFCDQTGAAPKTWNLTTETPRQFRVSPDGRWFACSDDDGRVLIRSVADETRLFLGQGHFDSCSAMQFSPDSRMLATGGRDGTVFIWDLERIIGGARK